MEAVDLRYLELSRETKPVLDSGVEFEVIDFSACVKNYIQGKLI